MADSKTELANLALTRIQEEVILDINDTTNDAARKSKLLLEPVIREVARSHKWNALKTRAQLPQDTAGPAFEWDHSYTLPVDCLQVVKVNGYSVDHAYIQDHFEIEARRILTNADEAKIQYIRFTDNVTIFDPLLDRAIATLLSSYLAGALQGDHQLSQALREEYEKIVLKRAQRVDAQEGNPRHLSLINRSKWLQSRRIQPGEGTVSSTAPS